MNCDDLGPKYSLTEYAALRGIKYHALYSRLYRAENKPEVAFICKGKPRYRLGDLDKFMADWQESHKRECK